MVHKVHSHVVNRDGSPKQPKPDAPGYIACACGSLPCDPNHRHHKGNEVADEWAKAGAQDDASATQLDPMDGEETYHVKAEGELVQGDLKARLQEIETAIQRREVASSEKSSLRTVGRALQLSARSIRHACVKTDAVPYSFWARALSNQLPTYERESKRAQEEGSAYAERFKGKIEGGCQPLRSTRPQNPQGLALRRTPRRTKRQAAKRNTHMQSRQWELTRACAPPPM